MFPKILWLYPLEIIEKKLPKIHFFGKISQFLPKEQSIPPYFLNSPRGILIV